MRRLALIITFCVVGFVAILILLGALLFSVKDVQINMPTCRPEFYRAYAEAIADRVDYVKGKNVLFLNESGIADTVAGEPFGIEQDTSVIVTDVIRVFPNTVRLEVQHIYPHGYVEICDGQQAVTGYVVVDNNFRIVRTTETQPTAVAKLESVSDIAVRVGKVGEVLQTDSASFDNMMTKTFRAFARIGYREFNFTSIVKSVRLDTRNDIVTIVTRNGDKDGSTWRILGTAVYEEKIRAAASLYVSNDGIYQSSDYELTVSVNDKGKLQCSAYRKGSSSNGG